MSSLFISKFLIEFRLSRQDYIHEALALALALELTLQSPSPRPSSASRSLSQCLRASMCVPGEVCIPSAPSPATCSHVVPCVFTLAGLSPGDRML